MKQISEFRIVQQIIMLTVENPFVLTDLVLFAGSSCALAVNLIVEIARRATYSGFPEMECPFVNGIDKGANRAGRLDGEMEEA